MSELNGKTQYKSFNGFKTTNSEWDGVDLCSLESGGGGRQHSLKGKVLIFFSKSSHNIPTGSSPTL